METRIVVIGNEENIRELLNACSETEGWRVSTYSYAAIDIAALSLHRPDLIILDFNFQEGGLGWEFLQRLKMETTTASIPILITTKNFQLSAEERSYLMSRYINVIQMPFALDTLVALVHKTLRLASQSGILFSSDHSLPILVVDDTEQLRDTIATILGFEGYQVVTADNGLVALESVSRVEHSLILLDMSMPVMDGLEFLTAYGRQLRPHTPVIILSADITVRKQSLPAFVVDVLPKPFVISHLLAQVKKYAQPVSG